MIHEHSHMYIMTEHSSLCIFCIKILTEKLALYRSTEASVSADEYTHTSMEDYMLYNITEAQIPHLPTQTDGILSKPLISIFSFMKLLTCIPLERRI